MLMGVRHEWPDEIRTALEILCDYVRERIANPSLSHEAFRRREDEDLRQVRSEANRQLLHWRRATCPDQQRDAASASPLSVEADVPAAAAEFADEADRLLGLDVSPEALMLRGELVVTTMRIKDSSTVNASRLWRLCWERREATGL
jgi:hypothetical protein